MAVYVCLSKVERKDRVEYSVIDCTLFAFFSQAQGNFNYSTTI